MSDLDPKLLALIVAVLGAVVWYLLRQKDLQQEEKLKLLFRKHDELVATRTEDVKAFQELRVHLADGHYKKPEVDIKFERLEYTFRDGLANLGNKFDKLADTLLQHLSKGDKQ